MEPPSVVVSGLSMPLTRTTEWLCAVSWAVLAVPGTYNDHLI